MSFTSNKKDKPTVIAGRVMPPGVAAGSATVRLAGRDKNGKPIWTTEVSVGSTTAVGRTAIDHVADGPYSRKETAEINEARHRAGAPVIKTTHHFKTSNPADLGQQPSELSQWLGSDKNKPGEAKRAAERAEKMRREEERRKPVTVKVPLSGDGPKMDR